VTRLDLSRKDTICALATAPAPAALAVIRISGPKAQQVRDTVFKPKRTPQRDFVATYGHVVESQIEDISKLSQSNYSIIDEALCTFFPDRRSYTGEPLFELSIHGGPSRVASTLRCLQAAGCRIAEPGEFTFRAFLTNRLDLCAAEAVHDVVSARSDAAAQVALRTLAGGLKDHLSQIRSTIIGELAEREARLDHPEEELGALDASLFATLCQGIESKLEALAQSARLGRRLTEGARVVLFGFPNVGKSTLLNTLIHEEKALVHDSPGTTRDVLEVDTQIGGIPVVLVDVAGVRSTGDIHPVEKLGIERAKIELEKADLVLFLKDGSSDADGHFSPADFITTATPYRVVKTKIDLQSANLTLTSEEIAVSAKTGQGIQALVQEIAKALEAEHDILNEVILTRSRQRVEVERCREAVKEARIAQSEQAPDEVVASELRQAGRALDRLLGLELDEDVLDEIFSRFCIGK
jgi:tRNA modification GTPase